MSNVSTFEYDLSYLFLQKINAEETFRFPFSIENDLLVEFNSAFSMFISRQMNRGMDID